LQGKPQAGFEGVMRFSLNTVLGLGGLLDIATPAGLTPEEEDFGQTLAKWRVWPEAHYLVLPFLGSTTTRKLAGDTVDGMADPVYQAKMIEDEGDTRLDLSIGNGFIEYVKVVPLLDEIKKQPDPYVFVREGYLQHRKNDLYDGNPPTPALDDFNFE
jgi:phospholipid-binding lipoprotein MlaA